MTSPLRSARLIALLVLANALPSQVVAQSNNSGLFKPKAAKPVVVAPAANPNATPSVTAAANTTGSQAPWTKTSVKLPFKNCVEGLKANTKGLASVKGVAPPAARVIKDTPQSYILSISYPGFTQQLQCDKNGVLTAFITAR